MAWHGGGSRSRSGRREQTQFQLAKEKRRLAIAALGLAALLWSSTIGAGAQHSARAADGKDQPYVIEYYYKAKRGQAEEFLALFKRNHDPVLKKEKDLGRMLKGTMLTP